MDTTLRPAPHYFVIDSIGGMNEGYSDTTCRRVEDVIAPELAKAMVEDYIDQWVHERTEYYMERVAETGATFELPVKYNVEECPHGGWVKLTPEFDENLDPENIEDWGFHTLFIQVNNSVMLGDAVIVYDQMDDRVRYIATRSHAIRMAEERISIEVERMKRNIHNGDADTFVTTNLIHAYDCLAEVVRELEYPQKVMVDIDDSCTHYFPVENCKRLIYLNGSRITTENID